MLPCARRLLGTRDSQVTQTMVPVLVELTAECLAPALGAMPRPGAEHISASPLRCKPACCPCRGLSEGGCIPEHISTSPALHRLSSPQVALGSLFRGLDVGSLQPTSLTLLYPLASPSNSTDIYLEPMEIATFRLRLS